MTCDNSLSWFKSEILLKRCYTNHYIPDNTQFELLKTIGTTHKANELILQYPEYLDALNRYGWSPLMQACREGHFECVKLLLQNGADPSICNLLGVNALTIATRGGHEKIVNLLFEHDVYLSKGLSENKIINIISNCPYAFMTYEIVLFCPCIPVYS